jgi:hypothetical protein
MATAYIQPTSPSLGATHHSVAPLLCTLPRVGNKCAAARTTAWCQVVGALSLIIAITAATFHLALARFCCCRNTDVAHSISTVHLPLFRSLFRK